MIIAVAAWVAVAVVVAVVVARVIARRDKQVPRPTTEQVAQQGASGSRLPRLPRQRKRRDDVPAPRPGRHR